MKNMSFDNPFQLTKDLVLNAGLELSDVGKWCVFADGAYHLFPTERLARQAHIMMQQGQMVR